MRLAKTLCAPALVIAVCATPVIEDSAYAGPGDKAPLPTRPAAIPGKALPRDPMPCAAAIDDFISRGLTEQSIPTSAPADDYEFLRRVHLDLTGRIPHRQQVLAFLGSKDPDKRRKVIDDLLASGAYAEHFATIWNNLIVPREEGSKD